MVSLVQSSKWTVASPPLVRTSQTFLSMARFSSLKKMSVRLLRSPPGPRMSRKKACSFAYMLPSPSGSFAMSKVDWIDIPKWVCRDHWTMESNWSVRERWTWAT